ncbi:MAG: prenyltransferase/squalene oxidase repeat-containing protein, partial [Planctomycetaceae bacterium]
AAQTGSLIMIADFCFDHRLWMVLAALAHAGGFPTQIQGQTPRTEDVREAIDRGVKYLESRQLSDGSFPADGVLTHPVDVTCLATLAFLGAGLTTDSFAVRGALGYLRNRPTQHADSTHELSLQILVWLATEEPADFSRAAALLPRLLERQTEAGGWAPRVAETAEPSLSHLALLALRDAVHAGLPVNRDVWERARRYWQATQNAEGSWGDAPAVSLPLRLEESPQAGTTLTAVTALTICRHMLSIETSLTADREIDCCRSLNADESLERGIRWLQQEMRRKSAAADAKQSIIYYLHGLEQTGRHGGQAFFAEQDWYAHGVAALMQRQQRGTGHWTGNHAVMSTSHAVLFLSQSLAPIIISKLRFGPRDPAEPRVIIGQDWNRHPCDVGNLAAFIAGRRGWPRKLATQEIDLESADPESGLEALQRAPVVFLTGTTAASAVLA